MNDLFSKHRGEKNFSYIAYLSHNSALIDFNVAGWKNEKKREICDVDIMASLIDKGCELCDTNLSMACKNYYYDM